MDWTEEDFEKAIREAEVGPDGSSVDAERAESYLAMARNSRGVEFDADIERVLCELPAKGAS
jgi:hypothetical protein